MASPGPISLTYDRLWRQLWSERFEDPLADAETFRRSADGRLLEIGRRTRTAGEIEGQYMGLLKFTREGWARTAAFLESVSPSERDRLDMTTLLARMVQGGETIQTVPLEGRWCEVDSDEDLRIYSGRLGDRMPWRHDWRWDEEAAA
jgi:choline kinase